MLVARTAKAALYLGFEVCIAASTSAAAAAAAGPAEGTASCKAHVGKDDDDISAAAKKI